MVQQEIVEATAETQWIRPALSVEEARERTVTFWSGAEAQQAPGHTMLKSIRPSRRPSRIAIKPYVLQKDDASSDGHADYELIKPLGEGGMGEVYAARQACMDRTVAIKMIRAESREDTERQARFLSEAAVTGELDHPNIVPIHSLGSSSEGGLFYAMKHVKGQPWSELLESMGLEENLDILQRVADAVAFAHSRDVIHMDLKPENIMLGRFGEVYVMDWGLAASVHKPGKAQLITETDLIGGTPAYMAPEMAAGDTDNIGFASDIYLLGAILFEILTGTTPHIGEDASACLVEAAQNAIQSTDCESPFLPIAYRAMATEPADRYEDVLAFQAALRECRSHAESHALHRQARKLLKTAKEDGRYEDFSEALFGYREALRLWPENPNAAKGLVSAKLIYAKAAYKRGDYDLALSLLQDDDKRHRKLRGEVESAMALRQGRQRRMRLLSGLAKGMAAALFVILAGSVWWIAREKTRVELAEADTRSALAQEKEARVELERMRKRLEEVLGLGASVPAEDERKSQALEEDAELSDVEEELDSVQATRKKADRAVNGLRTQLPVPPSVATGPAVGEKSRKKGGQRESEAEADLAKDGKSKEKPEDPAKPKPDTLVGSPSPEDRAVDTARTVPLKVNSDELPKRRGSIASGEGAGEKRGVFQGLEERIRGGGGSAEDKEVADRNAGQAVQRKAQVEALEEAPEKAPEAAPVAARHPLLLLYRSALLQFDLASARRYAAHLARQQGQLQKTGAHCLADIQDLETLQSAVGRSLAKRGNRNQTLALGQGHQVSGRVEMTGNGQIRFHRSGSRPIVKTVLDLSPETLAQLLKEDEAAKDTELLLALSAYARGDAKQAARSFRAIAEDDPRSAHHAEMLRW